MAYEASGGIMPFHVRACLCQSTLEIEAENASVAFATLRHSLAVLTLANVADATQVRTLSELGWFLTTGTLAQLFALVVVVVKLFMSPLQGMSPGLTPRRVSCAVLSVQGPSSHSP